jgi:Zn ribbon nucleic-acid-binding protein
MKFGLLSKVKCPACTITCSHKLIFSNDGIEHLCCSECGKVGVFAVEMEDGKEEDEKRKKELSFIDYVSVMERRGSKPSNPYSIKKAFTNGDYLGHSKFGDGYVVTVLPPNKMMVMFEDEKRLLICGPDSKSGATKMTAAKKKTSKEKTTQEKSAASSGNEPMKCPRCGASVHLYNISKNPKGKIVGCMHCSKK